MKLIYLSFLVSMAYACQSQSTKVSNPNFNTRYAFVTAVSKPGDSLWIEIDEVEYLKGEPAIEAAKKAHAADTFKSTDGKVHVAVPNDYFILNEQVNVVRMTFSDDCVFKLQNEMHEIPKEKKTNFHDFKSVYVDALFLFTFNERNQLSKVTEIFIP